MKKSEYLRKAATQITDYPSSYNWAFASTCNCGILTQVVMGISATTLREEYTAPYVANWTSLIRQFELGDDSVCVVSGMKVEKMLNTLEEAGFTMRELEDLEYLANPAYTKGDYCYHDRQDVIAYLSKWAETLESKGL